MPSNALLLGDSHMQGAFGRRLEALLREDNPSGVIWTYARQGIGVPGVLEALRSVRRSDLPDPIGLVLVELGVNDWGRDVAPWRAAVASLAAYLEDLAPSARLVWLGPPEVDDQDRDPSWQWLELDQVLGPRWELVDSEALTEDLERTPDGIHYPEESGRTWAERTFAVLAKAGKPSTAYQVGAVIGGLLVAGGALYGVTQAVKRLRRRR